MPIKHHPDVASLMSCAAGSQPEVFGAVVASHLSVCPACMREVARLERIGVALFDRIEPAEMTKPAPIAALRALDAEDDAADDAAASKPRLSNEVPVPLAEVIGSDLDAIAWKRLAPGVWHYPLSVSDSATGDLRLVKVAPGHTIPDHGHTGSEMTLVLRGSFRDNTGHYLPGDVADLADEIEHAPVADPVAGCICLIASEKPARFKGLIARMVQPLTGL